MAGAACCLIFVQLIYASKQRKALELGDMEATAKTSSGGRKKVEHQTRWMNGDERWGGKTKIEEVTESERHRVSSGADVEMRFVCHRGSKLKFHRT